MWGGGCELFLVLLSLGLQVGNLGKSRQLKRSKLRLEELELLICKDAMLFTF